jgi:hypothetical protein
MNRTLYVFVFLSFLLISGCQNRIKDKAQPATEDFAEFDRLEEVKDVYYRFPSPDEMLNFIDKEKIYFNDALINSTDRASSYLNSKSQALNLGVYIADLAYVTLFNRQKEALVYMQVVYGLSDKLRIASAFDLESARKFEENLGNLDSLKVLADQSLTEITNYLIREDKERILAIISIGGFVESLYLAFQMVDEFSEDDIIIQRISDQKLVLENILNYSEEFSEDNNVSEAITLVQPIRAIYNKLVTSTEETEVRRDENGKLIIGGGEKIAINEAQFKELKETTTQVRQIIIENR